jgi:hypothetical protein
MESIDEEKILAHLNYENEKLDNQFKRMTFLSFIDPFNG